MSSSNVPLLLLTQYAVAVFIFAGWLFVWSMHLVALINAKLKLHKKVDLLTGVSSSGNDPHRQLITNSAASFPDEPATIVIDSKPCQTHNYFPPHQNRYSNSCNPFPAHAKNQNHLFLHSDSGRSCRSCGMSSEVQRVSAVSSHIASSTHVNQYYHHLSSSYSSATPPASLPISNSMHHHCDDACWPGVSILKPLVGADPNLFHNLESFFVMDYPKYELLFCIQDSRDAAMLFVEQLIAKYPAVDTKVFIGGRYVGVNPKINNMTPGYEAAKYPFVLVSDSGVSMKCDTLRDMVASMLPDTALVHQMPFVCDRKGFTAILEKVYFGTAHARVYLSADLFGVNCPTGMSALMRKAPLDEVGGIQAFAQFLAEDFFFAKSFTDRGWKIRIASQPAWQNAATSDINTFQNRISRWAQLRFAMVPHWTLLEPVSECLILGIFAAWSVSFLFNLDPFTVYLFHLLLWFLLDYLLLCLVQNGPLPFSKTDFVVAWMFRECIALLLYIRAVTQSQIKWRTGTYRLRWGGVAEKVPEKVPPASTSTTAAASPSANSSPTSAQSATCAPDAHNSTMHRLSSNSGSKTNTSVQLLTTNSSCSSGTTTATMTTTTTRTDLMDPAETSSPASGSTLNLISSGASEVSTMLLDSTRPLLSHATNGTKLIRMNV